MTRDRITTKDVRRAFERHIEILGEAGITAERAEVTIDAPGDSKGTRYGVINTPTISSQTHLGARAAYDAITAATFTVAAVLREQKIQRAGS